MNEQEIAALTGQNFQEATFPIIRINEEDQTPDGKDIPRGSWALTVGGETLYGKSLSMQIMTSTLQYRLYDATKKVTDRTIHFRNFNEELIDTKGTTRLGRPVKKVMDTLPAEEQAKHKKVRLYRWVFGLASMEGVNDNGEKNTFVEVPAFFRFGGKSYQEVDPYIKAFDQEKILLPSIMTEFTLRREQAVSRTMFVAVPARKDKLKMDEKVIEHIKAFGDFINKDNSYVQEQWKKFRTKSGGELNDSLSDLLDGVSSDMSLED